jgi:hypothetical protein
MKITIANRDPDNPDNTKEVAPVSLELEELQDALTDERPDFSDAIAGAAHDSAMARTVEEQKTDRRNAKALAEARLKQAKDDIRAETGFNVGYDNLRVFKSKPKAAYNLWKRVVPVLVQKPETLEMTVIELTQWFDERELNYRITRDMFYAKLNKLAIMDLERLLDKLDVKLVLKSPVSLAKVRTLLIERRDAASGLEADEFKGDFSVQGETFSCNGRRHKVQLGASGKPRIKTIAGWLPLDALKAVCSTR